MTTDLYRFSLVRTVSPSPILVPLGNANRTRLVTMLNPSVAEAKDGGKNDPTVNKLIHFCRRDGFGRLIVENVFPFRATDPTDLIDWLEAGYDIFRRDENNQVLRDSASVADQVVVAWGANVARPQLWGRAREVEDLLRTFTDKLYCFGETNGGYPRHPLYLKNTTPVVGYHNP